MKRKVFLPTLALGILAFGLALRAGAPKTETVSYKSGDESVSAYLARAMAAPFMKPRIWSRKKGDRRNATTSRLKRHDGNLSNATLDSKLNGSWRSLMVTTPVVAPSLT